MIHGIWCKEYGLRGSFVLIEARLFTHSMQKHECRFPFRSTNSKLVCKFVRLNSKEKQKRLCEWTFHTTCCYKFIRDNHNLIKCRKFYTTHTHRSSHTILDSQHYTHYAVYTSSLIKSEQSDFHSWQSKKKTYRIIYCQRSKTKQNKTKRIWIDVFANPKTFTQNTKTEMLRLCGLNKYYENIQHTQNTHPHTSIQNASIRNRENEKVCFEKDPILQRLLLFLYFWYFQRRSILHSLVRRTISHHVFNMK